WNADGLLAADDGSVVQGTTGPLTIGTGKVMVAEDGTVRVGDAVAGTLAVVTFADPGRLVREGSLLRSDGMEQEPVARVAIHGSALEESNVSVVERIAELTDVRRSFEALQKAITLEGSSDSKAME